MENENVEYMQAIAENEAAKSSTGHNWLYWFGIIALTLNFVVAVLAAIFGCTCKSISEKSWLDWFILSISLVALIVAYILSIIDYTNTKKDNCKAEQDKTERNKANNGKPTMSLLEIRENTKQIKESAKRHYTLQKISLGLLSVAALLAIIVIIIP